MANTFDNIGFFFKELMEKKNDGNAAPAIASPPAPAQEAPETKITQAADVEKKNAAPVEVAITSSPATAQESPHTSKSKNLPLVYRPVQSRFTYIDTSNKEVSKGVAGILSTNGTACRRLRLSDVIGVESTVETASPAEIHEENSDVEGDRAAEEVPPVPTKIGDPAVLANFPASSSRGFADLLSAHRPLTLGDTIPKEAAVVEAVLVAAHSVLDQQLQFDKVKGISISPKQRMRCVRVAGANIRPKSVKSMRHLKTTLGRREKTHPQRQGCQKQPQRTMDRRIEINSQRKQPGNLPTSAAMKIEEQPTQEPKRGFWTALSKILKIPLFVLKEVFKWASGRNGQEQPNCVETETCPQHLQSQQQQKRPQMGIRPQQKQESQPLQKTVHAQPKQQPEGKSNPETEICPHQKEEPKGGFWSGVGNFLEIALRIFREVFKSSSKALVKIKDIRINIGSTVHVENHYHKKTK